MIPGHYALPDQKSNMINASSCLTLCPQYFRSKLSISYTVCCLATSDSVCGLRCAVDFILRLDILQIVNENTVTHFH